MTTAQLEHPPGPILVAYGLGELDEADWAEIDGHLATCTECRQVVEGVVPDTLMTMLRSAATDPERIAPKDLAPETSPAPATNAAPLAELAAHPRYRVVELLGVGGMGAVYRAEHLLMERPVALKVLNRKFTDKPATVERFRREVRAAARLTHPNIVAAFDAEQASDIHFLAMEFVEGISLARHGAERGPLPVSEACEYIRQAALGLQHAHERGMVHRDIKPQNLMLTPSGQVKILDFGLSRFVVESAPADTSLSMEPDPTAVPGQEMAAIRLTHTGLVMGTPDYIAPEQARDSHVADIRADIYSLGCTLYELLAGQAPFPDGTAIHKVKGHLSRTPQSLESLRRDVPLELIRVVDRMMAKDPANRFQTPAEVAAAMAPFVASKPPHSNARIAVAACAAFLTAVLTGTVIYVQTDNGRIVIETHDEAIAVMIRKAGGVKIVDHANKRAYVLLPGERVVPSGEYLIDVAEPLSGLQFQTKRFTLKRGGEERLVATFVPPGNAKADGQAPIIIDTNNEKIGAPRSDGVYQGKPATFWRSQFEDGDPKLRIAAVRALGSLGQKNANVIPVLVAALNDPDEAVGHEAGWALRSAGALAIPAIIDVLKDQKTSVAFERMKTALHEGRRATFDLPGQFGNPAGVLQGALGGIGGGGGALGGGLAGALGGGGGIGGAVGGAPPNHSAQPAPVPLLTEILRIKDAEMRRQAIQALFWHGDKARPAIPRMLDVFDDVLNDLERDLKAGKKIDVSSSAYGQPMEILQSIGRADAAADAVISKELTDAYDPKKPSRSIPLWRNVYRALRAQYPALQSVPGTSNIPNVPTAAAVADGPLYSGKPASYWLNRFDDSDARFRVEAIEAIGNLAVKDKSLLPVIVKALDDDEDVALESLKAAAKLAKKEKSLLPVIVKALRREDQVAMIASSHLASLGPDVPPALLEGLDWDSAVAVGHAAETIRYIGPKAAVAVPKLTQSLKFDFRDQYRNLSLTSPIPVTQALAQIGPDAKPAIPGIIEVLGRVLESKETLDALASTEREGKGHAETLPVQIVDALLLIDPEIKEVLPAGMYNPETPRSRLGVSTVASVELWKKTLEVLKKRYPTQQSNAIPAKQPQKGAEIAPMPEVKDEGPLYQGKSVGVWLRHLDDGDPKLRSDAVIALRIIARKSPMQIPLLVPSFVATLKDEDEGVGRQASLALREAGAPAYPAILEILKDKKAGVAWVRMSAALAHDPTLEGMPGIPPNSAPAPVPLLIEVLKIDDLDARIAAAYALNLSSKAALPAIPKLLDLFGDQLNAIETATKEGKEAETKRMALVYWIIQAIWAADPDSHKLIARDRNKAYDGKNFKELQAFWRQTYDALQKNYPRLEVAPMPQGAKGARRG